jgi:hypothetical protein
VVHIFIVRTGETSGSVAELVPKTPLIGGETLLPGQPAENFALERGSAPPKLLRSLLDS